VRGHGLCRRSQHADDHAAVKGMGSQNGVWVRMLAADERI
jgi:hypothetical protein